ncbi:MAG: hypothetical protein QOE89_1901 [Pseudonocardiales bacterium]|jgi:hypothetical protein|nr:hypothetical protein [Pseudonocardiales bacterium]
MITQSKSPGGETESTRCLGRDGATSRWPAHAGRLLAFVLAVIAAILLAVTLWPTNKSATPISGPASAGAISSTSVTAPRTAADTTDHTNHAGSGVAADGSGSVEGYDASLHLIPAGVGTDRTVVIEVDLTVEATPASAPTASGQLRRPDGHVRPIALGVTGAGQWRSASLTIPAGRYTLTARFDRQGHPLTIPISFTVS